MRRRRRSPLAALAGGVGARRRGRSPRSAFAAAASGWSTATCSSSAACSCSGSCGRPASPARRRRALALRARAAAARARGRERPASSRELEREVVARRRQRRSTSTARLRPVLREVAAHRLASARGPAARRGSPEVRAALGDDALGAPAARPRSRRTTASRPGCRSARLARSRRRGWRGSSLRSMAATMTLEEVGALSERVLDEVERAVIGKRDALELRPARRARRRQRAARGLPGPGEDAGRALVRAGDDARLRAHPVHARPDAVRRHRLVDLQPAQRRVRVPAGPDLHEPPARRRDQPRPAEDAGGAARGDAGAPGHDRGRDAPARRGRSSCSRRRTRSSTRAPTRCPRRSSTASCSGSGSATRRPTTSGGCSSGAPSGATDEVELRPVVDGPTLLAMQRALEQVYVSESDRPLHGRPRHGDARRARACRSARARAGRSRC